MSSILYPNFVQHLRRYISLSNSDLETLAKYIESLVLEKKAYLLEEGEVCRANYFVEKGCLRLFFINEKGNEQIVQFALENWWLADYMSLSMKTHSPFYIQTIEPSKIIAIPQHREEELLASLPQLEKYFRLMFQRTNAAFQLRFKFAYDYSKEESYRHFTSSFPAFVQRIPQYMLASYLGFTPEYLSELRKKVNG